MKQCLLRSRLLRRRCALPDDLLRATSAAYKPTFNFTIDGAERKATEACAAYLVLLQRMVATFEADHP
jgi:hypothetical protein